MADRSNFDVKLVEVDRDYAHILVDYAKYILV